MNKDQRLVRRLLLRGRTFTKTFAIAAVGLGATFAPRSARATLQWVQTSAGGCATSIAVGPNGYPYVTGCGPGADHDIFVLGEGCPPSDPNCTLTEPMWFDVSYGLQASRVSVAPNGGGYWAFSSGGDWVFALLTVSAASTSPAGGVELFPVNSGCLTWLQPGPGTPDPSTGAFSGQNTLWGLGCGQANEGIFQWNLDLIENPDVSSDSYQQSPGWQQVDPQDGAAATQMAMFAEPTNNFVLWVLNSLGNVYTFDGVTFHQITTAPPGVISITDHFVAYEFVDESTCGPAGCVVRTGVQQWNDGTGTFDPYIGLVTPNGTFIQQIAHAGVVDNGNAPMGPSHLWGIDQYGSIFSVEDVQGGGGGGGSG